MKTNYPNGWSVQFKRPLTDLANEQDLFCDLMNQVTKITPSGHAIFYGLNAEGKYGYAYDKAFGTCLTLEEGIAELRHILKPEIVSKNEEIATNFMKKHFPHLTKNFHDCGVDVLTKFQDEQDYDKVLKHINQQAAGKGRRDDNPTIIY